MCPVETPEGQACGLVENLSILTYVRMGSDGSLITCLLKNHNMLKDSSDTSLCAWRVMVNGSIEGFCEDGLEFSAKLRKWRRSMLIPADTSIAAEVLEKIVMIDTDAGCLLRPLFVRSKLHSLPDLIKKCPPWDIWNTLFIEGVVELIDKIEEKCIHLGKTHVELHPSCMLGICAGMIPFLNHNQAPRNIYEAATVD